MGVDIRKQIITGAFFSDEDLGKKFVDDYDMEEKYKDIFGNKVELITPDPYGVDDKTLPDFIIGIVEEYLEGDGERAKIEEKPSIEYLEDNNDNKELVTSVIRKLNFDIEKHQIKRFKIIYLT